MRGAPPGCKPEKCCVISVSISAGIDVADDDDRHAAGAIVVAIELAQALGWKALEDFWCADRDAVDVSAVTEERLELRLLHARARAETSAPFLDHDATLAIDLRAVERDAAGEIAQRFEPARQRALASVGTSSMYTVSSKLVYAFTCGPNGAPIDSRYETSSPGLKCVLPLNAMCSSKCASPR